MSKIYQLLMIVFLIGGCKEIGTKITDPEAAVLFDQDLADEMKKMAEIDQIAAYIPQGDYKKLSKQEWAFFKDSVFTTHQKRVAKIFEEKRISRI